MGEIKKTRGVIDPLLPDREASGGHGALGRKEFIYGPLPVT